MTEALIRIGEAILSFLKKSWEYIALGLSIILGYLVFFDDSAQEKIEKSLRKQKRLQDEDQKLQKKEREVEGEKKGLEKELNDLEEKEKEIRKDLRKDSPKPKENEENVKDWLQNNYGDEND
jgi:septal ring factor EnvC (AmiA/AmiB activator)